MPRKRTPAPTPLFQPPVAGPTSWMDRFRHALSLFCGGKEAPLEYCELWLRNEQVNGADPLQDWVAYNLSVYWATGIGTIEAAQVMADNPEEGVEHLDRDE